MGRRGVETSVGLDCSPDLVLDAGPGVGGESQTAREVKAQDGPPEAEAAGMQSLGERHVAQHLSAHHGVDEALVVGHQGVQALTASRLGLLEQGGLGDRTGATRSLVVKDHRTPPWKLMD